MSNENYEIERKFLVKELPSNLNDYKKLKICQGYICTEPTMRLRQQDDEYIFTFKSAGRIKRIEFEYELSLGQFENLWKKVETSMIIKNRYLIPLKNELIAELDIYEENLKGFANVEVEFSTIEDANLFIPPEWFGEEVTFDKRYSNSQLSIFGIPVK